MGVPGQDARGLSDAVRMSGVKEGDGITSFATEGLKHTAGPSLALFRVEPIQTGAGSVLAQRAVSNQANSATRVSEHGS